MVELLLEPILEQLLGKTLNTNKYFKILNTFFVYRAYIANRVTDKLTKITDSIYCCRSGSAADTQAIADIVAYNLNFHWYVKL